MADAIKRVRTTVRHEYVLRSPTPAAEVMKAVSWARSEMPEEMRKWDDSLWVEACDDEVTVFWEQAK